MSLVKDAYPTSSVYCVALRPRDLGKEFFGHGSGYVNFVKSRINGALIDT